MGNGIEPKITIAAMVCFFPTLVNMVRGLEDVNPQSLELMLSASKREIFFKLRLYNSLPYLFSALHRRLHVGDRRGGRRMDRGHGRRGRHDHPGHLRLRFGLAVCRDRPVYAAIVLCAALSGSFLIITLVERWLIKWKPEQSH